jgi:hypothetical protein
MKHSEAKALLLFIILTLPNWSAAQTNSRDSKPTSAIVAAESPRMTNELPLLVQVTNAPLCRRDAEYFFTGPQTASQIRNLPRGNPGVALFALCHL